VPSRLIHDQDGVCVVLYIAGYLDQVLVHGMGVAPRHDESRRLALLGADRAEDVGGARSLVMGRGWPRSPLGPAAGDLVLLPDTSLVLKPDLDHFALGGTCGDFCHSGGEFFLNASAASTSCA
jgi:hypothetical protein